MSNGNSSIPVCEVPDRRLKADIVIRSGDGARLGAHKDSLYQFNQSFPRPSAPSAQKETIAYVKLDEPANILQLLLGLSHYDSGDSTSLISNCDLDIVLAVADAAENYDNQFAMALCKAAIDDFAWSSPENALRVMPYLLSPYKSMPGADALARYTMYLPTQAIEKHFTTRHASVYLVYAVYRYKWKVAMEQYEEAVHDSPHRSSYASDSTEKAVHYVQGAMLANRFPSF